MAAPLWKNAVTAYPSFADFARRTGLPKRAAWSTLAESRCFRSFGLDRLSITPSAWVLRRLPD